MTSAAAPRSVVPGTTRTDAVTDLALTMPLFVAYHVGVIFLPVRNAADVVTSRLAELAQHNMSLYVALTLAVGAATAMGLLFFGHRDKLRWESFVLVAIEGVLYAMAMRYVAVLVIGSLRLGPGVAGLEQTVFGSVIMSLGAGFYEEVAFRALAFGLGARLLMALDDWSPWLIYPLWGVICAAAFSLWHHIGPMGDPFDLKVFVFRTVCGLVFTAIYSFRGFAPAVWTHALYDVWAMVLALRLWVGLSAALVGRVVGRCAVLVGVRWGAAPRPGREERGPAAPSPPLRGGARSLGPQRIGAAPPCLGTMTPG